MKNDERRIVTRSTTMKKKVLKNADRSTARSTAMKKKVVKNADRSMATRSSTTKNKQQRVAIERSLPLDVVLDILLRLPLKSLARLRCVSKLWCSSINEANFVNKQHQRSPTLLIASFCKLGRKKIRLYDFGEYGEIENRMLPFQLGGDATYTKVQLSNAVNGLICGYPPQGSTDNEYYYLSNPSTRELLQLPAAWPGVMDHMPAHFWCTLGLGFDVSSGRYKLVLLSTVASKPGRICMVLTVGSDQKWRYVGDVPCYPDGKPIFLHEAIHWIVPKGNQAAMVLAFDVKDEKFRTISVPESVPSWQMAMNECGGHLRLIVQHQTYLSMWTLEEYLNQKWTREYDFDLHCLFAKSHRFHFVGIKDGKVLLQTFLLNERPRSPVIAYDLLSKTFKELRVEDRGFMGLYKESLLSPRYLLQ